MYRLSHDKSAKGPRGIAYILVTSAGTGEEWDGRPAKLYSLDRSFEMLPIGELGTGRRQGSHEAGRTPL